MTDTPKRHPESKAKRYDVEVGTPGAEVVSDAVFGDMGEGGPNYRAVSGLGAFVLMTKSNLGLGLLGIPGVFDVVGIVPGIILIVVMASIIGYLAVIIGPFKINHPQAYGVPEAGLVFGGRWTQQFLAVAFWLFMVTTVSGSISSLSTAWNALSTHGACTALFIGMATITVWLFGSIRTLGKVTWLGWFGLVCLLISVLILTIAVGVQDRPADAPLTGPWDKDFKVVATPTFAQAMVAVNTVLFSYGATPTYFNIVSEMRDPRKYTRALSFSLSMITVLYLIIGSVVYYFCGQYVSTPALGSAGVLLKKVCYGIAMPALLGTGVIYGHLGSKTIFVRLLQGSPHLSSNSPTHWLTWYGCTLFTFVIAYIIASAVPNFGSIISLIGALIVPSVSICPYTFMWWHTHYRYASAEERKEPRRRLILVINVVLFFVGIFITGAGTYGAVKDVIKTSAGSGPWSCNDNSNSV